MKQILIVEDKASVRVTLEAVLSEAGYQTHSLADGAAASAYMQNPDAPPDLIICDIIMPKVNGIEFVTGLRAVNNTVPVLFISGGGYDMVADEMLQAAAPLANGILKKPFANNELVNAVREILGT